MALCCLFLEVALLGVFAEAARAKSWGGVLHTAVPPLGVGHAVWLEVGEVAVIGELGEVVAVTSDVGDSKELAIASATTSEEEGAGEEIGLG